MTARTFRRAAAGAVAATLALGGGAGAHEATDAEHGDLAGVSTLEHRITGDGAGEFEFLRLTNGEPYAVRDDLVAADPGRATRRSSLLYFGQLTDFQVADEESPARVEFFDMTANPPFPPTFSAAHRPQEALVPHGVDASIRQMNRFLDSPVPQADGTRARMGFALMTGDLADSQQLNETEWVRTLLEGGTLDPNSGSSDPRDYAGCPIGTPGPAEAARYTGVQDYDDYVEGNQYYDPDSPSGIWSDWPRYPGLMDRAQVAFQTPGLAVPTYVTFGNHDGLAQGNAAAIAPYEAVGTGCIKPLAPAQNQFDLAGTLDPAYLSGLAVTDPSKVALVPPDPRRRYVDRKEFKQVFASGEQADAHGFDYVDPQELEASNDRAAYYSWTPAGTDFRFISLDTLSEAGVPGPSSNGNIDDPQFRWLERELDEAEQANQLVVLFGHHPIRSLSTDLPDEMAPPCTIDDGHGHDVNPGCDEDPRDSRPIHLGADLERLLLAHDNVIAYVAGHTHEHKVTPFARADGSGGFWGIETASVLDWPPQTRVLDVMDNGDGTLSIFGTVLDGAAPVSAPAPGDATAFDQVDLASVGRTLAYNDPQAGKGTGEGTPIDRNVELLVPDPRR